MESRMVRCLFALFCTVVLFVPCSYAMEEFHEAHGIGCCCLKDVVVEFMMNSVSCCIACAHELSKEAHNGQVQSHDKQLHKVSDVVKQQLLQPKCCNVMGEYLVMNKEGQDYGDNE